MDDEFRIGPVSPYDAIHQGHNDVTSKRKRRSPSEPPPEEEDIVSISGEPTDDDIAPPGYGPPRGGAGA